jgi:hypothetical protein
MASHLFEPIAIGAVQLPPQYHLARSEGWRRIRDQIEANA